MLRTVQLAAIAIVASITAWALLATTAQQAAAQSGPLYINAVDLDIVPAQFDKFIALIKANGAASVKEPGCREFNIVVSQKEPHHVFLFEVYDNAAALDAHRTTEHFKTYQAGSAGIVAKREVRGFSSVAMNTKSK